jgi:hypothetical protein
MEISTRNNKPYIGKSTSYVKRSEKSFHEKGIVITKSHMISYGSSCYNALEIKSTLMLIAIVDGRQITKWHNRNKKFEGRSITYYANLFSKELEKGMYL